MEYGNYQYPQPPKSSAALVLSVIGLVLALLCGGLIFVGLILSIIGTAQAGECNDPQAARVVGIIGIVLNSIMLLAWVLILVFPTLLLFGLMI